MRKSTVYTLVVMVIAAMILPACGGAATTAAACKAGLVTDVGKINDGTFNQYAYDGLKKAEKDLGIGTKYIETQAQTDYGKNIQALVDQKCEVIVAVGFTLLAIQFVIDFARILMVGSDNSPVSEQLKGLD